MTERQRTVALMIDYDNLQICYSRDAPGTQLDLGAVMALAQSYGRVVVARAYAEWNLLSERLAVYKAGMEPAFAPVLRPEGSNREGKSLADTVMVSDGVDLLWTHQPDVLVLVTSDKDMVPLARLAKQRGALVVVLGSDLTAVQLLEMANEFVTYRHLIRELGRPEAKLAASRVREEPHVRRGREPSSSREVVAAREATQRAPRALPTRTRPRTEGELPEPAAPIPAAQELVAPAAAAPSAALGQVEGRPVLLDETGQPIAPRRRRRRGGRGRRTGLAEERSEAPTEEREAEAEAVDAEIRAAEEQVSAGQGVEQDAGSEAGLAELAPAAGERVVRRRPARPRPARQPETAPAAESAETQPTEGPAAAPPAAEPGREAPTLRPWERWPGQEAQPAGPPERSPVAHSSALERPEPGRNSSASAGSATETEVERAAEPVEAVEAAVAADWSPAAEEAAGPTEPAKPPARRRRVRRPAAAAATEKAEG